MFANKYYERDIEYVFATNRFFFRLVGIWPFASVNSFIPELVKTVPLILTCFVSLLGEIIPIMLYIFMVLTDVRLRLKVVGSAIFAIVELIKYSYVLLYKDQVRNCLMLVDEDWRNIVSPSVRDSMIDRVRTGKRLIVICAVLVYITGLSTRLAMPLAVGKIVTPENITIRPLPCVAHLVILDVQQTPIYELMYFIQSLSGFIKYTITVATFGFVTVCGMHFCAQSEMLMQLMNNFVNESRSENLNKRLATVVEHQIRIRNFLELVQNVTQFTSLIEIVGSTIMICFAGYYIIMEWEDNNIVRLCTYLSALIMFCFNVFIYCYMGEQIIEQGEKIALTACTLEWYDLPDDKARSIILIIIMSNSPKKLQGGKFIDLSFRTFGNIVKMAVTYLNLLRSVVE
ncbi:odorant receptor 4-like [Pogonomyrmex barbatus]|uniref:Odorant receptor n=1 Tax=Pogonomyrmex barbatus TaxID=144034 RepID=A0A8N1SB39_9HYME|nr:odorant receptor 4-like [Pogonomyrmex barbatus]